MGVRGGLREEKRTLAGADTRGAAGEHDDAGVGGPDRLEGGGGRGVQNGGEGLTGGDALEELDARDEETGAGSGDGLVDVAGAAET